MNSKNDIIRREDAIEALNGIIDIKGFAYTQMHDAIMAIPSIGTDYGKGYYDGHADGYEEGYDDACMDLTDDDLCGQHEEEAEE